MSTRVCLILAIAWFGLVTCAQGQSVAGDARAAVNVSNAPRAVSYAQNVEDGSAPAKAGPPAATTAAPQGLPAMPLPPRSQPKTRSTEASAAGSSGRALLTVLSSLAVVLAVFFAFVWLTRSAAPKGMAPLSKDVVESLGRAPLLGRQQMQLIRIGNKLVLLSVTPTGADTLTEITDPVEVDRLAGLCRQSQSGSISDTFRQVLAQATVEPAGATRQPLRARSLGSRRV